MMPPTPRPICEAVRPRPIAGAIAIAATVPDPKVFSIGSRLSTLA